jgi:tetratricopeptide (TPR) repeat protein
MSAESTDRDGEIAAEGPIWEGVVPGVLRGVYVGRRTGTLTFVQGGELRGVQFRHGSIVNADTNVREDRLGPVLVRAGRLTEAGRKRAEGFALRDGRRLGAVLVDLGLLDRAGLEEALALHVDAVLSKVFAWTDGRYEFRLGGDLPTGDGDVTLRVSTGDLILKAARSVQDPDVVRYNLGDLGRVLVASSDPLLRFQRIRLAPLDGFVMSRVDGVLSARELIGLIPMPPREVEQSLYALLSTGVVEFRSDDASATRKELAAARPTRPDVAAPEPTVILDRPSFEELAPPDPTVILDRLDHAWRAADPTILLDAGVLEPPAPVDPTVVVNGAFEPLSAVDLRRIEIRELHRSLPAKSHFELLGIPREATEAQVREAYFRLAKRYHPDGQHDGDLGDVREALEAIFRRLGEAYEALRNPRIRAAYERSLGRQPEGVREARADPPSPALEIEDPEQLLALAAESFARESRREAILLLERALPRAGGALKQRARVLLAGAYAAEPDRIKQGEELLVAAVQQDPGLAEAHFQLGVIYAGQGLRGRALSAFRRVVELEPGNAEAGRRIADLLSAP